MNSRLLLAVPLAVVASGPAASAGEPPAHVRGRALEMAHGQAVEASRAAALAGSGHEAASILAGVLARAPGSDAARDAAALLDDWGLKGLEPGSIAPGEVAARVRRSLEVEELAARAAQQARVYVSLERADLAAEAVLQVPAAEARGAAGRKLDELWAALGIAASPGEPILALPPDELRRRLERGGRALRLLRLKRFLTDADPPLGKVFASLLAHVLPETQTLKLEEDRGFIAMPGMAFAGGGRGPRGGFGGFGGFGPGGFGPPGGFAPPGGFGGGFGGGRGGPGGGRGGPGGFDIAPMIRGFEDQIRGRVPPPPAPAPPEPAGPPASPDDCVQAIAALRVRDLDAARELSLLAVAAHQDHPGAARLREAAAALQAPAASAPASPEPGSLAPADLHFEVDEVASYALDIPADSIAALRRDAKAYMPATLRSHGRTFEDVGVRLKGSIGTFQPLDGLSKPGFTVKIDFTDPHQELDGLRKLILANGLQSAGGLGEWLAYGLFRRAGLPAPRIAFATVGVNGAEHGLHVEAEALSKRFLRSWFGDDGGDLFEGPGDIDRWQDLDADTNEETADRTALESLATAAHAAEEGKTLDPLRELVDVAELARFVALEGLLAHWDGYISTNNYRLYHNPLSRRFTLIPHGADQVLGSTRTDAFAPGRGALARALLAGNEGRDLHRRELRWILDHVFLVEEMRRDLVRAYRLVEPHILADTRSPIPPVEVLRRIEGLASRIEDRRRFVTWQLAAVGDADLAARLGRLARPAGPFGFGR